MIKKDGRLPFQNELKDGERIKELKEYPKYYISTHGRVWTSKYNRWLNVYTKTAYNNQCMPFVQIFDKNGIKKSININRLVYQHFVSELNDTYKIYPKDGNRLNNHYTNLKAIHYSKYNFLLYQYDKYGNFIKSTKLHNFKFRTNIYTSVNKLENLKKGKIYFRIGYIWLDQYLSKEELKKYFPIRQYDRKTGELINSFCSIQVAAHYMGIANRCLENIIVHKRNKPYKGYFWKRKTYSEYKEKIKIPKKYKTIYQYDKQGNFIRAVSPEDRKKYFYGLSFNDFDDYNVKGYLWRYKKLSKKEIKNSFPIHQYDKTGKWIDSYYNIAEARKITGITTIHNAINQKTKKFKKDKIAGGYIWKYVKK